MFFERPGSGERVILVHMPPARRRERPQNPNTADDASIDGPLQALPEHPPAIGAQKNLSQSPGTYSSASEQQEFLELALASGASILGGLDGTVRSINPSTYLGSGKLAELKQLRDKHGCELVIFNHSLSPSQERNLEKVLCCRVLDRTGLILDIFAQRARTHEGKLQVELAQLDYVSTRLVRGWTHLERQKGGIGLRGPGETQLETDRRLLGARIKSLQGRLEKVRKQRALGRRARQRSATPTVSMVGYTNAGKSTLFNRATAAEVFVADQLFATLDPTLRQFEIEQLGTIVLADTVGFIRELPHKLIDAFKATLEEARLADLLIHVVDAGSSERDANIAAVQEVLAEIQAAEIPTLYVFNKIDTLTGTLAEPRIDRDGAGRPLRVWLSAQTGNGLELFQVALRELLSPQQANGELRLPAGADYGRLRARLHALNAVIEEVHNEDGSAAIQISLPRDELDRLLGKSGLAPDLFIAAPVQGGENT